MRKKSNPRINNWRQKHPALFEPLENRHLLAGDLVAHWRADDLNDSVKDGDVVGTWIDTVGGIAATATGTPQLIKNGFGTRAGIRFDKADQVDYFAVAADKNPLAGVGDFSISVAFSSASTELIGDQGQWFSNTGLVDANSAGFTKDWGVSINHSGQIAAGIGRGGLDQGQTVYSTATGLNDGSPHVATFTRQDGNLSIYVDQFPPVTRSDADKLPRDRMPIHIGSLTNGDKPFVGQVTEVRIFNGALTAAEAQGVYRSITAPIAAEDFYFVSPGQTLTVNSADGVLKNDIAISAGGLAPQIASNPTRGTVSLAADGSFTYSPTVGFTSGVDTFTYKVRLGQNLSNEARVSLVINTEADFQKVAINELHVDPDIDTDLIEFIELHNTGSIPVSLAGWRLDGGAEHAFSSAAQIAAGGYFTITQNLEAFKTKFGVEAGGQFIGKLGNAGETLELRAQGGALIDRVDYGLGFPWPTVGDEPGYSMELINPSLDNQLGGSWRSSVGSQELIGDGDSWMYFKGTKEPSNGTPLWRQVGFDDTTWLKGSGPFGFSTRVPIGTQFSDMRNGYSSVYLRKTIQIADPAAIRGLKLQALYDDGFNLWINGTHVVSQNVPGVEVAFNAVADSSKSQTTYDDFELPDPSRYLVAGTNIIAVQLLNNSLSNTDAYFDARLLDLARPAAGPSPGALNSIYSTVAAPQLRQVIHTPNQPKSNQDVTISVRATDPDKVALVSLDYQVVQPGKYIRRTDAEYANWTTVPMYDDGTHGDQVKGDDVYTVVLPASLQAHRHVVRYRVSAVDSSGLSVTAPYADDPQPNFAYFVYDGIPGWTGADRPGTTDPVTFSTDVMNQLPAYHLIALKDDVNRSQYVAAAEEVRFLGTMVYDGIVYDHIEFGVRGEFSTYVSGKNKWKFFFNRGHDFQARDNYGRPYNSTWSTMNFSSASTPWVPMNRGMAGIDEAIAYRLYELAGNPSPKTNFLQLRVIDDADQAPASQYDGDLWGIYLTLENPDGRFLDERGLPDGTTYKIENALGDIKNQGPTQPDATREFRDMMTGANRQNTEQWWRDNIDLDTYFTFRAVNRGINNMDIRDGWNHYLYHNPETNQWSTMPWDLDMLYVPTTHWSGVIRYENAIRHSSLNIEYGNRARELQDLLFSVDQIGQLVDEYAGFVNPQTGAMTMVDVDQFLWNYHPRSTTSGTYSHQGKFNRKEARWDGFQSPTGTRTLVTADHEGFAQWIKDFMLPAPGGGSTPAGYGAKQLDQHATDTAIPSSPTITYVGAANYAIDGLAFKTNAFVDPQGNDTFAALEWRLAEVTDRTAPKFDPKAPPNYEIQSVWESGELTPFQDIISIPGHVVEAGHAYRARVRMKDSTGRYSHWSAPIQFTATAGNPTDLINGLRISEVHYNPAAPSVAELAAGFTDNDDFEFIELANISGKTLDLSLARLIEAPIPAGGSEGVDFDFANGQIKTLQPDQRLVIVENLAAFRARYGDNVSVAGEWNGRLDNSSEQLTLDAAGVVIQQFAYSDQWHPATDGDGRSLESVNPSQPDLNQWKVKAGWQASGGIGGSPGGGGRAIPGDSNHDGIFNSSDLVAVFQAGEYEDAVPGNSTFEEGDWNGDGDFDTKDMVLAFQTGRYMAAAIAAARSAVDDDVTAGLVARFPTFQSIPKSTGTHLKPSGISGRNYIELAKRPQWRENPWSAATIFGEDQTDELSVAFVDRVLGDSSLGFHPGVFTDVDAG